VPAGIRPDAARSGADQSYRARDAEANAAASASALGRSSGAAGVAAGVVDGIAGGIGAASGSGSVSNVNFELGGVASEAAKKPVPHWKKNAPRYASAVAASGAVSSSAPSSASSSSAAASSSSSAASVPAVATSAKRHIPQVLERLVQYARLNFHHHLDAAL
jgi:hypothetical protein